MVNKVDNQIVAKLEDEIEKQFVDYGYSKELFSAIEGIDKGKWTANQKIGAMVGVLMTSSYKKAAASVGVPYSTIRAWTQTGWWKNGMDILRKQKNEELDTRLTTMFDTMMDEIEDRILRGDEVLGPNGDTRRKKIGGKELTTMLGILYDKRALMRGDPTSRSVQTTPASVLKDIKDQFEKIADNVTERASLLEKQEKAIKGEVL